MNDLPPIVAWIIAIVIAAIVCLIWRHLRFDPKPTASNWPKRGITWLFISSTLGPVVVVTILSIAGLFLRWREVESQPLQMLGQAVVGIVVMGLWNVLVALLFFSLPYLPILLLWARMGPRLGRLESSRKGLAVAAMLLALPAALAGISAYGVMDEPFGFQGMELLKLGLIIWVATSVSLFLPRILVAALRPGIFGGPDGRASNAI